MMYRTVGVELQFCQLIHCSLHSMWNIMLMSAIVNLLFDCGNLPNGNLYASFMTFIQLRDHSEYHAVVVYQHCWLVCRPWFLALQGLDFTNVSASITDCSDRGISCTTQYNLNSFILYLLQFLRPWSKQY